jgi:hypothetical protein
MIHLLRRSWSLLALLALAAAPVKAVGPTAVMFHGGPLAKPVVQRCNFEDNVCAFLWSVRRGGYSYTERKQVPLPTGLGGRAYVNVAIFWGLPDDLSALKPEDASQHARLYMPTKADKAVVVATSPNMQGPDGTRPVGLPVPADLEEFVSGWTLEDWEVAPFRRSVPGLSKTE